MKKYYNFETMFTSLRDSLRAYLKDSKIYYELSGADNYYHFEILCTEDQVNIINNYLDSISIVNA